MPEIGIYQSALEVEVAWRFCLRKLEKVGIQALT